MNVRDLQTCARVLKWLLENDERRVLANDEIRSVLELVEEQTDGREPPCNLQGCTTKVPHYHPGLRNST